MSKKTKSDSKKNPQKLSKNQLKKLKGGLTVCLETRCVTNTCGGEKSKEHCSGTQYATLSISGGNAGSEPKAKK